MNTAARRALADRDLTTGDVALVVREVAKIRPRPDPADHVARRCGLPVDISRAAIALARSEGLLEGV